MLNVSPASLDWALAHAENYGDTDVFPVPFEYSAVRFDWNNVRAILASADLHNWAVRPHRRLLSPKARYGFRVVTQLDPLDFLVFTALVYEIAAILESTRVSSDYVYSYRIGTENDGRFFDPSVGHGTFQLRSRELLDSTPNISHVVVADIADFYGRIYLHRLENSLSAAGAARDHIMSIMRMLSGWNGRESFGIPVGIAASRILAEITISDVDSALLANGASYMRYNDDYRIFCTSHAEAYRHLTFLADSLFRSQGLSLQPLKTAILTREEFAARQLRFYEEREVK